MRLNIAVIPYIGLLPAVTRNGRLQCAISYTKWRVWNRLTLHEMGTKGCGHRRKQGGQEPGRPKMVHTARLPNPSCTMDQTKLENQPKMVHPARMGLPSCSMDQKVSRSHPYVAAWFRFSAPPPNNAFRATPAPRRIRSPKAGLFCQYDGPYDPLRQENTPALRRNAPPRPLTVGPAQGSARETTVPAQPRRGGAP